MNKGRGSLRLDEDIDCVACVDHNDDANVNNNNNNNNSSNSNNNININIDDDDADRLSNATSVTTLQHACLHHMGADGSYAQNANGTHSFAALFLESIQQTPKIVHQKLSVCVNVGTLTGKMILSLGLKLIYIYISSLYQH